MNSTGTGEQCRKIIFRFGPEKKSGKPDFPSGKFNTGADPEADPRRLEPAMGTPEGAGSAARSRPSAADKRSRWDGEGASPAAAFLVCPELPSARSDGGSEGERRKRGTAGGG